MHFDYEMFESKLCLCRLILGGLGRGEWKVVIWVQYTLCMGKLGRWVSVMEMRGTCFGKKIKAGDSSEFLTGIYR